MKILTLNFTYGTCLHSRGGRTDLSAIEEEVKRFGTLSPKPEETLDDAKTDPAEIQAAAVGNSTPANLTSNCIWERSSGNRSELHVCRRCIPSGLRVRRAVGLLGAQWIMADSTTPFWWRRGATKDNVVARRSDVLGAAADYHIEKPEYGDFMFRNCSGALRRLHREVCASERTWHGSPKKLCARTPEPLCTNAEADLTYDGVAGFRQKPVCGAAIESFRLFADHGWRCVARVGSGKYLDRIGRDKSTLPRLLGFGHTTDYLALEKKDAPTFSTARKAPRRLSRWRSSAARHSGAEVHDCFSITEIVAYEFLAGGEGKGAELAKSGATALPQVGRTY